MIPITELFDLSHTLAGTHLANLHAPWDVLCDMEALLHTLGSELPTTQYFSPKEGVWIHRSASVAHGACIHAPCIIGEGSEIRHNAYIRGAALIGKGCVIGNATEIKNAILFDGVQVPHYNYVGDSILGYRAHLGAGAIISNVKGDRSPVSVCLDGGRIPTGRKKLGALLGDDVEIGCGSVLNPGTIVGRATRVYPLCCVRGTLPPASILKSDGTLVSQQVRG